MQSHEAESSGIKVYFLVYLAILVIAAMQILLAYQILDTSRLLFRMFALAIVQAGLAIFFFMHMRWERRSLMFALIPTTIFVLLMMNMIWTDSFRLLHLKPFLH